jgi:Flp pilus assembly pilin Flp
MGRKGDMFARLAIRVWSRWCSPGDGQDLLEYALLVALIALAAVAAVTSVGTTINTVLWNAIDATTSAL